MRFYFNAPEMLEEVTRDLVEMGIRTHTQTMQDKFIGDNPAFATRELCNYSLCLMNAKSSEVPGVSQPWANAEFEERIFDPWERDGYGTIQEPQKANFINPGEAYKLRQKVWAEFLHLGKMGYSYNELFWQNDQITKLLHALASDMNSRQIWLSLWNPEIHPNCVGGKSRVPCSLGYGIQIREGKVNLHYVMRSCYFATHFRNDVYLAIRFMEWVAQMSGLPVGNLTMTIFSLHIYEKDTKGVF